MKKGKAASYLIIISALLYISSPGAFADERSIFVGDLINIRISTQKFTEAELRNKFKDFEIVDIKNDSQDFLVTLRSFETGEKTVRLGNKEIKIIVKSTLDEIERDEIFEGDLSHKEAGFSIDWQYVFYFLLTIFLATGGINLWKLVKKRRISLLSPYRRFISRANNIALYDSDYFVKLTLCFKEYLESRTYFRIKGKTSTEIIDEISCVPDFNTKLPAIGAWLKESDYYKFTGVTVSNDRKQKLHEELVELVESFEKEKEGKI